MSTANPNAAKVPAVRRPVRVVMALSVVALLSCVVAVALALLAPDAAPVRTGSAQDFWKVVCGEKQYPPGALGHWAGYVTPRGAFLYEDCTLESTVLYEAPEAEVNAQFEQVVAKLGDPEIPFRPYVVEGFKTWQAGLPQAGRNPEALVKAINEALFAKALSDHPRAYYYHQFLSDQVEERRVRANWFWAAVVFEWVFLTAFLLWVSWPVVRGGGRMRWAVHLGAAPFLLYLPLYFDYAPYLYTSIEPSGGIHYPWMVVWFRGLPGWPLGPLDTWILRHMPPLLEPLSLKIGPVMAWTTFGIPGPTQMLAIGAVLALLILFGPRLTSLYIRQLRTIAAAHRVLTPDRTASAAQHIIHPVSANQSPSPPTSPAPG
jgi:hypothetical protein